jgi:hypothetical protein
MSLSNYLPQAMRYVLLILLIYPELQKPLNISFQKKKRKFKTVTLNVLI